MTQPPLKLKRTDVLNRRPSPEALYEGELAVNYHSGSPGIFFKDTNSNLVKVGSASVNSNPPESSENVPLSVGELWYDLTSESLKIWTGSEWKSCVAVPDAQPLIESIVFVNSDGSTSNFG